MSPGFLQGCAARELVECCSLTQQKSIRILVYIDASERTDWCVIHEVMYLSPTISIRQIANSFPR